MSAGNGRRRRVLITTVLGLVIAQTTYSPQNTQPSQTRAKRQASFTLTIENDLISLTTRDASVKAILGELDRRMNSAVVAAIPGEETITTEFAKLPLKEVLARLVSNYAYVTDSAKDMGRITKIMVTPEEKGVARVVSSSSKSTRHLAPSQPEPFKFEFDPTDQRSR